MTCQYEIRPIRKSDNPRVAGIIRDVMTEFGVVGCGSSINDHEVDDMYKAYSDTQSAFFVVTNKTEVMGCGGIGPLQGEDKDICELRKMYFLPEIRGNGMGTRLLELCLEQAKERGYRLCYLETDESMSNARQLYGKHGFESLEKPMGDTGHSACNTWLAKDLLT